MSDENKFKKEKKQDIKDEQPVQEPEEAPKEPLETDAVPSEDSEIKSPEPPAEEPKEPEPPIDEQPPEPKPSPEDREPEDMIKESPEKPAKPEEPKPSEPPSSEPSAEKPPKGPPRAPKPADGKKDDFQYIVRIANTDVDGNKTVVHGLAQIKGIGLHMSVLIADAAGIDRQFKIGDLTDSQIEKIQHVLDNLKSTAPAWMMNQRKDVDTGEDLHIISSDVDLRLRDNINVLKMIRSYRGIRHEMGLAVRGQRTRANGRRGLAMGVSRKSQQQQRKSKE